MEDLKYLEEVKQLISSLRVLDTVTKRVEAKAKAKLLNFLKCEENIRNISEEALSTISLNMLEKIHEHQQSKTELPNYVGLNIPLPNIDHTATGFNADRVNWKRHSEDKQFSDAVSSHPITRYFLTGVENFINTRLRRWSSEDENGQIGPRARFEQKSDQTDEEFWSEVFQGATIFNDDENKKKVVNTLLDKGMEIDAIRYLFMYLSGISWVQMAEEMGGTADKYRNSVKRSLESAHLPNVSEIKKI